MAKQQLALNDVLDNALDGVTHPDLDKLYEDAGKKYNLNPLWLKAQDQHEIGSHGGDMTAGDAMHIGHGQIGPALRRKYGISDMPSAAEGIDDMAHIMRDLVDKHHGDIYSAMLEYTGGPNEKYWGPHTVDYPKAVETNLRALGGSPNQIAYPGGQGDVLDDALKNFSPSTPPAAAPPAVSGAGFMGRFTNALMGGAGNAVTAAYANSSPDDWSVAPTPGNIPADRAALAHDNALYAGTNPGASVTADLLGGLVPAAAAIGTGNELGVLPLARSVSALGPVAARGVQMLTGSLPREAPFLAKALSRIVPGMAAGGTAAVTQSGLSDKPLGEQIKTGAEVGGVLGPAFGALGDAISSHIEQRTAEQANRLIQAGIDLKPSQIPGVSPVVNWLGNKLTDVSGAVQRSQLAHALSRTFGENTPELTKDTLEGAQKRIGGMFDRFENATIPKDQKSALDSGIIDVLGNAHGDLGEGTGIPDDKLKQLRDAARLISGGFGKDGSMSGKTYLQLTKRGSTLDRLALDPDVGHHAQLLRDELDSALERSVSAAGGRWVPAGQQQAAQSARTQAALPGAPVNKLLGTGSSSDIRLPAQSDSTAVGPWTGTNNGGFQWDGPQSVTGSLAPGKPPAPGMVWEIDPATQGALELLRSARGQYKNLKIVSGLADATTGEVQPAALARKVARFYPPNDKRALTPSEAQMLTLAASKNFIPPGPSGAKGTNKLLSAAHAGAGGVVALAGEKALEHIGADPTHAAWLAALGLIGGGGAKGTASLLNSPANARRIIANTLSNDPGATSLANQLLLPPAVQLYNKDSQK